MDVNDLLQEKREAILQIAAGHGAHNVCVFGSVARGEATKRVDDDYRIANPQIPSRG
jgi:predicted nucleotidyltransferase